MARAAPADDARAQADRRTRRARLAAAILEVLHNALENGGTSLRDFIAADGAEGDNADYLWVYGRGRVSRACVAKR